MTSRDSTFERFAAGNATREIRSYASDHARSLSAIGFKRALTLGEEAAFLWLSRNTVARSSAVTFDLLAREDDGLTSLLYELSARPVLGEFFLQHDHATLRPGLAFVTAFVALRNGLVEVFDELLLRLGSDVELLSPLASALAWFDFGDVRARIGELLVAESPVLVQLGLLSAVAHRVDPGAALDRALGEKHAGLRASAFEAVGRLGLQGLEPRLRAAFEEEDAACRFWAAWSAVRLGARDRDALSVLGRFAAECGAFAGPACEIGLRALEPPEAVRAHSRLLTMTGNHRLGVVAAGIVGDPAFAAGLLDEMESPMLARRAAASFCLMTGVDLRRDDLDGAPQSGGGEMITTADSAPDAERNRTSPAQHVGLPGVEEDDALPWPDPARLRQWWDANGRAFVPGVRYLAGLPTRLTELESVLRTGNQQQRAAAVLELGLLDCHVPLLDVTAPAHQQARRVGSR